ncbi:hypothetical protein PHJA_000168400 [Phtheirospermum japonicum]|uniref:Uncharacterized protein n=1 Tax=Phtheirospermum japonicum TaxID=374723 RepID=A0A830AZ56_9LAMI|nr:hypothetical protein PHJA_000168400 [Phtheirospermum japonicum]
MVRKEMKFLESENLVGFDAYEDVLLIESDLELKKYETSLEEDSFEDSHRNWLSFLLNMKSTTKRRKEKDDDDDDNVREIDRDSYRDDEVANDIHYGLFLKNLTEHGNSYVFEDERDGLVIYEGDDEGSDNEECNSVDYKRKLRCGMEKNNGPSNESRLASREEAEDSGRKELRSGGAESEKVENAKQPIELSNNNGPSDESQFTSSEDSGRRELRSGAKSEIEEDPDYCVFSRGVKVVEGCAVYEYGGYKIVYEVDGGESDRERDGEWGLYVEILERDTFYKEVNSSPSMEDATDGLENTNSKHGYSNLDTQFEFRRQLIAALRKPYDEEEYDKLWGDITFRKPEKRHLELRHGRDRSCSIDKYGKSYLDHHPDLKNQLSRLDDDDKPKRLNLLRGFFFWLKKASHNGSFHPWGDAECLSMNDPDSG